MKIDAKSELAKRMSLLGRSADRYEPTAVYDPDGDCIEFLALPDPFYAERVDDLVTVYYSQETDEVVGSLIKGISRFCEGLNRSMPGFRIEIQDGRIKIEHVFRARLWSQDQDRTGLATLTYRKLIAMAEASEVEAALSLAPS